MIPLATTTVSSTRATLSGLEDPYDSPAVAPTPVVSGLRAVIGRPNAKVGLVGGQRVEIDAAMVCDPADIEAGDVVTDAQGNTWQVVTVASVAAFGFAHLNVGLRQVTGAT